MKERIKASLRAAFNAAKLRINGLRPFNAPAARSNGSAFWPFPKPKNLEQWWWLFTIGTSLPRPLQKEGSQNSLLSIVNNNRLSSPLLFGRGWGRAIITQP